MLHQIEEENRARMEKESLIAKLEQEELDLIQRLQNTHLKQKEGTTVMQHLIPSKRLYHQRRIRIYRYEWFIIIAIYITVSDKRIRKGDNYLMHLTTSNVFLQGIE